jgi:DNA-binding CsgD family transcriptional regulator
MYRFDLECIDLTAGDLGGVSQVVDYIGRDGFHGHLLSFLHEAVGAEHCATFVLNQEKPKVIGAMSLDGHTANQQIDLYLNKYWRLDPTLSAARGMIDRKSASLWRLDVGRLPPSGLRDLVYRKTHISDRVLLSGPGASLSVLRSEKSGKFSSAEIGRLGAVGYVLLSIVEKHVELVTRPSDLSAAFSSLQEIMSCIANSPEGLPRREVEVCALILFGVSTMGIASRLNIGEETVKTYRKRAYERLGKATQRELLTWYIERWGKHRFSLN